MKLNIQLFGGRGASSSNTKSTYKTQIASEVLEMKERGFNFATAVNFYKSSRDISLEKAKNDVKEYWSKKTGKVGNRRFFVYKEVPKGFKQESETKNYIIYINKKGDRILIKK